MNHFRRRIDATPVSKLASAITEPDATVPRIMTSPLLYSTAMKCSVKFNPVQVIHVYALRKAYIMRRSGPAFGSFFNFASGAYPLLVVLSLLTVPLCSSCKINLASALPVSLAPSPEGHRRCVTLTFRITEFPAVCVNSGYILEVPRRKLITDS